MRISDWSSDVCSSDLSPIPIEMPGAHAIAVKRIYDPVDAGDGARFLVDRLWPRGVSKEKADLAAWLKPLSPSDAMREQFHHATAGSDAAWRAIGRAHV